MENYIQGNVFQIEGEENILGIEISKIKDKPKYLEGFKFYLLHVESDLVSNLDSYLRNQAKEIMKIAEFYLLAKTLASACQLYNLLGEQLCLELRCKLLINGNKRIFLINNSVDQIENYLFAKKKEMPRFNSLNENEKMKVLKQMLKGFDNAKIYEKLFNKALDKKVILMKEQSVAKIELKEFPSIVETAPTEITQIKSKNLNRYDKAPIQLAPQEVKKFKEQPATVNEEYKSLNGDISMDDSFLNDALNIIQVKRLELPTRPLDEKNLDKQSFMQEDTRLLPEDCHELHSMTGN